MELTLAKLKELLANNTIAGLNAFIGVMYESNLEKAHADLVALGKSYCPTEDWYVSDLNLKKMTRLFELAETEYSDWLDNFMRDKIMYTLNFAHYELGYLMMYGLNPTSLPLNDRYRGDIPTIQLCRKRIMLAWIKDMICLIGDEINA